MDRGAADQAFTQGKIVAEPLRDARERFDSFARDFGADAVAWEYEYVEIQSVAPAATPCTASWISAMISSLRTPFLRSAISMKRWYT